MKTWTLKEIGKTAFPDYRGRKFRIETKYFPREVNSYWDGGTRSYYVFLNLQNGAIVPVGSNHPMFESQKPNAVPIDLPPEIVIVEHVYFCGKDLGIRVYVKKEVLPALPEYNPRVLMEVENVNSGAM